MTRIPVTNPNPQMPPAVEDRPGILYVHFMYTVPSPLNDRPDARAYVRGLFGVDMSALGPEEGGIVAGMRIAKALAAMLTTLEEETAKYNAEHPAPEQADEDPEKEVELQA